MPAVANAIEKIVYTPEGIAAALKIECHPQGFYKKVKGGSTVDVQGLLVNLPPVGKVVNMFTGKVEEREIIKRSDKPEEQYWEKQQVPDWLKSRSADEWKKQLFNADYVDASLEAYRATEWDRRLNGVWFMNEGEATFVTGMNYMFLQWWKMDVPTDFRIPDVEYFYFLQYCIEDPNCYGMLEITKRRTGKTYRAGLFSFEYTSWMFSANSGIQSKTRVDAKKFFLKAVVRPFKWLPPFFRPNYDMGGGVTPKEKFSFEQTNVRGKAAESTMDKPELQSLIDFESSDLIAYDGQKEQRYVRDEFAKTWEVNVYDGLDVMRYCLTDNNGRIIGKALYTSTVEIDDDGKVKGRTKKESSLSDQAAKAIWDDSDHMNKVNGQTASGLYRFFMPAHRLRNINIYGKCNEEANRQEILKEWEILKGNPKRLAARKRKEPLTIAHAFGESGIDCHFNSEHLKENVDDIAWNVKNPEIFGERGNYHWTDGKECTTSYWTPDTNGRWIRWWDFMHAHMTNNVEKRGNMFYPKNKVGFISGADPFENDITEDTRNSKGASHVFCRFDPNGSKSEYSNSFVCEYLARPKTAALYFDDMLKQSFYYGVPLLFENNKSKIEDFFKDKRCEDFLIRLPDYENYGIPSTPENKRLLVNLWEDYVENHHRKIRSLRLNEQLLKFDVNRTQLFDLVMSSGWTLVANYYKRHVTEKTEERKITDYFREFKIPA